MFPNHSIGRIEKLYLTLTEIPQGPPDRRLDRETTEEGWTLGVGRGVIGWTSLTGRGRRGGERLKWVVADLTLDKDMLREALQKVVRPAVYRELAAWVRTAFQTSKTLKGGRKNSGKTITTFDPTAA